MRKSTVVARVASVSGLCVLTLTLVGCTPSADSRHAEFLSNPTPNLNTYADSRYEVSNRTSTTLDTNFRQLNYELGKVFFLDRPMRGEYPIPY